MLGQFRYQRKPSGNCVLMQMLWDGDRRAACLHLPETLQSEIERAALPSAAETFSIDGALAYGLVLSIRSGLCFRLSGDLTVWPEEWGELVHLH